MADQSRESDSGEHGGVAPYGESPPGVPRWVKLAAIIIGILVALFIVVLVTGIGGQHGPGRHISTGTSTGDPADVQPALMLSDG